MPVKLLITDDSPDIVRYLEFIFKRQGFEPHTARDGREALQVAEKVKPDVVLLDTMMPEMDGLETCRRMRQLPYMLDKPIIMYSALVGSEVHDDALAAGATDFLGKSIGHDALVDRVRELLAASANAGGVGPALLVRTALDIAVLLEVEIVWLLGKNADGSALIHSAAASELGEQAALKFVQTVGKEPFDLHDGNLLATTLTSGKPRFDMPLDDLAAAPGGKKLSTALQQIGANAACLMPVQMDEEVLGMVVYSSPRTLDASPQYQRALKPVTRYAALALTLSK